MLRRIVALCLLLGVVTACGGTGAEKADTYWLTESVTDADRMELLRKARGIDPCALLPREALGEYGEILRIFNPGPSMCRAEIDSTKAGGEIQLDLEVAVRWAGVPELEEKPSRTIEGARVTSDGDAVLDTEEGRRQARRCAATAVFPSMATLAVNISNPAGTEPCPIGEQVLTAALQAWNNQPAQGTSPDTVLTVVNDIDPCATATALGVTVPAAPQTMWSCIFRYNGHLVSLRYGYAHALASPPPQAFDVGPHRVYRSDIVDSERVLYTSTIGPPIHTAEAANPLGPRLPELTAIGDEESSTEAVVRRALTSIPGR